MLNEGTSIQANKRVVFFLAGWLYPKDGKEFLHTLLPTGMSVEEGETLINSMHHLRN
jgi:hypothetical protein